MVNKNEELSASRIAARENRLAEIRKMNLLDNAFMSVAMNDILACQHVLRILLNRPELTVKAVRTQYRLSKITSHDAVLDVLAEDVGKELYITEIQQDGALDHGRRVRFYSAMVDSEFLEKGAEYYEMPELHVVYISRGDIWHGKTSEYCLMKTLVPKGKEGAADMFVPYDDGNHVTFVNAEINDGSELSKLMKYFRRSDPKDMSQGDLSKRVHFLKCEEGGAKELSSYTEKWWQEGRDEGVRDGEEKKARETSCNLFRKGMSVEEIAEIVQYSVSVVEQWVLGISASR